MPSIVAREGEAASEIAKHEQILRNRMAALSDAVNRGDTSAIGRLEDDIAAYEGDYLYWKDAQARGRHVPRGFIEAQDPLQTTREAIAAGYPEPPKGYFYRRWPNPKKDAPQYQCVRGQGAAADAVSLQPVKRGDSWMLEPSDTQGKLPHLYDAVNVSSAAILDDLLQRSKSLRQFNAMLDQLDALRNGNGYYRRRMEKIILAERLQSRNIRNRALTGVVDENTLRHAIKEELKPDLFHFLDELDDARSHRMLRKLTDDLNSSDLGNMAEEWYARRYAAKGRRQVSANKAELAKGNPPVHLKGDRHIDNLDVDGTAIEIKSGTGPLDEREIEQLDDLLEIAEKGARVGPSRQVVRRVKYVWTRPEGLRANLKHIERLFKESRTRDIEVLVEAFLGDGSHVVIENLDDLQRVKGRL